MTESSLNVSTSPNKSYALNVVRGIAIVLVMLHHQFFFSQENEATLGLLLGGWLGVDLFFALSGFLITGILLSIFYGRSSQTLKIFFFNRMKRLLPALLVFLSIWAIILLSNLGNLQNILAQSYNEPSTVSSVALWGFLSPLFGFANYAIMFLPYPVSLGHLWSLAIEWQFYLGLPLLLLFLGAYKKKFSFLNMMIVFVSMYIVLGLIFIFTTDNIMQAYLGTPGRILVVLAGGLAAILASPMYAHETQRLSTIVNNPKVLSPLLFILLLLLSLPWFLADKSSFTVLTYLMPIVGLGSAFLVYLSAQIPNSFFASLGGWRKSFSWIFVLFNWFGQRSYAAYLWNWTFVFVLYSLILRDHSIVVFDSPTANTIFYTAIVWVFTWVVAEISWWTVERRWILSKKH